MSRETIQAASPNWFSWVVGR